MEGLTLTLQLGTLGKIATFRAVTICCRFDL